MKKNDVAILDFGSLGVTAMVGERGVNKTFVIKGESFFNTMALQTAGFLTKKNS